MQTEKINLHESWRIETVPVSKTDHGIVEPYMYY